MYIRSEVCSSLEPVLKKFESHPCPVLTNIKNRVAKKRCLASGQKIST